MCFFIYIHILISYIMHIYISYIMYMYMIFWVEALVMISGDDTWGTTQWRPCSCHHYSPWPLASRSSSLEVYRSTGLPKGNQLIYVIIPVFTWLLYIYIYICMLTIISWFLPSTFYGMRTLVYLRQDLLFFLYKKCQTTKPLEVPKVRSCKCSKTSQEF